MTLTVIIADNSPFIFMQEPVRHRSVHVELTKEQEDKIRLCQTGISNGQVIRESISMCFIEEQQR